MAYNKQLRITFLLKYILLKCTSGARNTSLVVLQLIILVPPLASLLVILLKTIWNYCIEFSLTFLKVLCTKCNIIINYHIKSNNNLKTDAFTYKIIQSVLWMQMELFIISLVEIVFIIFLFINHKFILLK